LTRPDEQPIPVPADTGEWVAYCAPGRSAVAAILTALRPEPVIAVHETPHITGDSIILVNTAHLDGWNG
jgi:hypothetical protein